MSEVGNNSVDEYNTDEGYWRSIGRLSATLPPTEDVCGRLHVALTRGLITDPAVRTAASNAVRLMTRALNGDLPADKKREVALYHEALDRLVETTRRFDPEVVEDRVAARRELSRVWSSACDKLAREREDIRLELRTLDQERKGWEAVAKTLGQAFLDDADGIDTMDYSRAVGYLCLDLTHAIDVMRERRRVTERTMSVIAGRVVEAMGAIDRRNPDVEQVAKKSSNEDSTGLAVYLYDTDAPVLGDWGTTDADSSKQYALARRIRGRNSGEDDQYNGLHDLLTLANEREQADAGVVEDVPDAVEDDPFGDDDIASDSETALALAGDGDEAGAGDRFQPANGYGAYLAYRGLAVVLAAHPDAVPVDHVVTGKYGSSYILATINDGEPVVPWNGWIGVDDRPDRPLQLNKSIAQFAALNVGKGYGWLPRPVGLGAWELVRFRASDLQRKVNPVLEDISGMDISKRTYPPFTKSGVTPAHRREFAHDIAVLQGRDEDEVLGELEAAVKTLPKDKAKDVDAIAGVIRSVYTGHPPVMDVHGIDFESSGLGQYRSLLINGGWCDADFRARPGDDAALLSHEDAQAYGIDESIAITGISTTHVHGVTAAALKGVPQLRFDRAAQETILNAIGAADGHPYVAHNATFENSFMLQHVGGYADGVKAGVIKIIDTMLLDKYLDDYEGKPNNKLDTYAHHWGVLDTDQHERHLGLQDTTIMLAAMHRHMAHLGMLGDEARRAPAAQPVGYGNRPVVDSIAITPTAPDRGDGAVDTSRFLY